MSLYTYDHLTNAVSAMPSPEAWGDAAAFFDLLADLALTEQGSPAAVESGRLEGLGAGEGEADYPNGSDAFYGNHCADADYPDRFALSAHGQVCAAVLAVWALLVVEQHRVRALGGEPARYLGL
ncbi:hypothetical protein [Ornithinimicrobium sufpigmenti]|uniref:hypothetical protein n=1 Tax=Ornithinimicrobium sufpigmenti TaxID=2508882 RepID=UPI0010358DF8|nr:MULTISPECIES: hypothetical protein [unclassified Ornithinimicrobium]